MKKFFYVKRLVMLVALAGLSTMQLWATTYSRPASYATSAAYRTNEPEQKAVDIVNNQRLDSVRRTAPQDYIRRVCSEISSHTKDRFLQAKLAHDVTVLLLFYDDANYWNNSVPQQDLASILKTRRAVCEGYANLFLALCDGIGLPCEKIHGYARGVGTSERGYEDPTDSNHAWNMVQIQGSWYLVDCTWDSGHMSGRTSVQDYSTTWLFIQPEQIIYSHYPSQYSHQLLEYPLDAATFASLPNLRPTLFDAARLLELPRKENKVAGVSILSYHTNPGCRLTFQIHDSSTDKSIPNTVFIEAGTETTPSRVYLAPPQPGTYKVQIFAWQEEGQNGEYGGHFFITTSGTKPVSLDLATPEGKALARSDKSYSPFPAGSLPRSSTSAIVSTKGSKSRPAPSLPSTPRRSASSSFLDSQEEAAMAGIFVGGGNLLQAREMGHQHSLSFGFLLPAFWLDDWDRVFYWGGKVGVEGNIAGSHSLDYTLLAGATLSLGWLHPYIEGGVGLSNGSWNPIWEFTPGIDLSLGKQSPLALGLFYKYRWHSDWEHITGKDEYLGARILIRPQNFFTMQLPDFSGKHVISLGYIFPTNLTTAATTGFSVGSKDNFGVSVSWEDSDHKQFPLILALSYRRSQVQEEGSSHQTVAHSSTNQEPVQTLTHHTLMLEGSLGCQLIPHIVCYAGAGIGLSYIPENQEEGGGHIAKNVPWQVQVGARVSLLNLLYIRIQAAYLHTGELLPSLHLGLPLF